MDSRVFSNDVLVAVVRRFRPAAAVSEIAAAHGSGLSDATVWRVDTTEGPLRLKAYPGKGAAAAACFARQSLLAELANRLPLVAAPLPTAEGKFTFATQECCWELTRWLPGEPLPTGKLPPQTIRDAMRALARFHLACQEAGPVDRRKPEAARDRLERLRSWYAKPAPTPANTPHVALREPYQRLRDAVGGIGRPRLLELEWRLAEAADVEMPVIHCWGDARRENMLWDGTTVTGLIDFAALRLDSPAVDLASLVGSLCECDRSAAAAAMQAYHSIRQIVVEERRLTEALLACWPVLTAANWLTWLGDPEFIVRDPAAVARRLDVTFRRLAHPCQ